MVGERQEEIVGIVPELRTWLWGGPPASCSKALEELEVKRLKKLVFLNALVMPKETAMLVTMPTNIENVKKLVKIAEKIESYIGHEATAQLLSNLLGVNIPMNRAEYIPESYDVAVVVRLKKRLQTPEDVKNVSLNDLEFYLVKYEKLRVY